MVRRQAREQMRRYYTLADVVVSSRATGRDLPLKVFDYLGAGKAIVATEIHVHRAVLNDDLAVMVRPDARGLADGIQRRLQDEALRDRCQRVAQVFAREHLGWEPFVRTVRRNYSAILTPGPRPVPRDE